MRKFLSILTLILAIVLTNGPAFAEPRSIDTPSQLAQRGQVCPLDCSGNGVCVGTRCQCHPGWRGAGCAQRRGNTRPAGGCVNDCSGRGECVNDRCLCYPGWRGGDCRLKVQGSLRCENGCFADRGWGICSNGKCICEEGRGGDDCRIDLDPVDEASSIFDGECPGGCGRNGLCIENQCLCRDGFSGRNCRIPPPGAPAKP